MGAKHAPPEKLEELPPPSGQRSRPEKAEGKPRMIAEGGGGGKGRFAPQTTYVVNNQRMWSLFSRLWRAHSSCTFASVSDVPPLDHGKSWSKCSSSVAPHFTHFPRSRFHTASLIAVGITRRRSTFGRTGVSKSSSPSTATKRNLNTERYSSCSCQESTKWNTPL